MNAESTHPAPPHLSSWQAAQESEHLATEAASSSAHHHNAGVVTYPPMAGQQRGPAPTPAPLPSPLPVPLPMRGVHFDDPRRILTAMSAQHQAHPLTPSHLPHTSLPAPCPTSPAALTLTSPHEASYGMAGRVPCIAYLR